MSETPSTSPASQTLSRGIRILEVLFRRPRPPHDRRDRDPSRVHRSIAYRLLRTLEDHGLVTRDAAGAVSLGARMAALAAGVAHDLQAEALPELTAIANELGMTCFLAVLDGARVHHAGQRRTAACRRERRPAPRRPASDHRRRPGQSDSRSAAEHRMARRSARVIARGRGGDEAPRLRHQP